MNIRKRSSHKDSLELTPFEDLLKGERIDHRPFLLGLINGTDSDLHVFVKRRWIGEKQLPKIRGTSRAIQRIFHLMRSIGPLLEARNKFFDDVCTISKSDGIGDDKEVEEYTRVYKSLLASTGSPSIVERYEAAEDELLNEISRFFTPAFLKLEVIGPSAWDITVVSTSLAYNFIRKLVGYARVGELDRFKQCAACKKWFFSRVDHQRCCSLGCRQRLHRNSPAFKEKRRLYMRLLRRQHKAKVFKSNHPAKTERASQKRERGN